jgi:hypothetical protein
MAEKYANTHSSAAPPRLRRLRGSSCVSPSPPRPRRHVLALARAYSLARQGRHRSQRAAAAVRVCRGEPLAVRVARRCACRAIRRAADTGMRPRCSTLRPASRLSRRRLDKCERPNREEFLRIACVLARAAAAVRASRARKRERARARGKRHNLAPPLLRRFLAALSLALASSCSARWALSSSLFTSRSTTFWSEGAERKEGTERIWELVHRC